MNTAVPPDNPAFFEVPVPPQEFGQDGGKFYRCYDALANDIDEKMVTGLKEHLDAVLIFAGLFAGVNSGFLTLTLPLLKPDPADDTNALLKQNNAILLSIALGRNDSLPSTINLPSETFLRPREALAVNAFFLMSLASTLLSAFFAVLGRQWLVYYRKKKFDEPDSQRREQLNAFLGAEAWGFERVLEGWPLSLLETGIFLFSLSLATYVWMLDRPAFLYLEGFLLLLFVPGLLTFHATTQTRGTPSPYRLPGLVSSFPQTVMGLIFALLWVVIILPGSIIRWTWQTLVVITRAIYDCWVHGSRYVNPPWIYIEIEIYGFKKFALDSIRSLHELDDGKKEADDATLQMATIKRTLCTSNEAQTQIYAVSNILAIADGNILGQLATNPSFARRISSLSASSYIQTLQICGRDRLDSAAEASWLYKAAITHIQLSTSDSTCSDWFLQGYSDKSTPSLSPDMIQQAPSSLVSAWLGYMADSRSSYPSKDRHVAIDSIIVGGVGPSWRCISMMIAVIMVEWSIEEGSHRILHAAYKGKPSIALQNLRSLVKKSNESQCHDQDTLRRYIVNIFRFAGKAAVAKRCPSSSESRGAAVVQVLRFSEDVIRAHDSPSDLINIGRNLRGELTSALLLEYEEPAAEMKYTFKEMLEELHNLFTGLTASIKLPAAMVSRWSITASNKEDVRLLSSFGPVLLKLNVMADTLDDWGGFGRDEDNAEFKHEVLKLNEMFASFKNAVQRVSRQIKMWKRDPDLGWCDYDEERESGARLEQEGELESQLT